jgi:hypothetical protein
MYYLSSLFITILIIRLSKKPLSRADLKVASYKARNLTYPAIVYEINISVPRVTA